MTHWYRDPAKITLGGLVFLALTFSVLAHFEPRFPGDLQVTLLFQSVDAQPLLAAMKGISYIAGGWRAVVVVIVTGLIIWRSMGRLEAGIVALSGLIASANEVFKIVIDRPRPTADLVNVLVAQTGASFPSGHAFFAVVVLGMLAYLTVTHQTSRHLRILVTTVFLMFILWIGASRIYLGAHWASDVIGGYIVGLPFLWLEIRLYQGLKLRLG